MKSQKIPKPVLTKGEGDGTLIAGTFSTFFKGASRKMGKKEATTERGGTLRVFGQNRIDPPHSSSFCYSFSQFFHENVVGVEQKSLLWAKIRFSPLQNDE